MQNTFFSQIEIKKIGMETGIKAAKGYDEDDATS
jgi:hypothetical protein